jgi:hypothetical protein
MTLFHLSNQMKIGTVLLLSVLSLAYLLLFRTDASSFARFKHQRYETNLQDEKVIISFHGYMYLFAYMFTIRFKQIFFKFIFLLYSKYRLI